MYISLVEHIFLWFLYKFHYGVFILQLISDLGLLVPGMEEASYLCKVTHVYMGQFAFVSPDDIKIGDKKWIGKSIDNSRTGLDTSKNQCSAPAVTALKNY